VTQVQSRGLDIPGWLVFKRFDFDERWVLIRQI